MAPKILRVCLLVFTVLIQNAQAFTFEDLTKIIRGKPAIDSMEDLLARLPEPFRLNYTMMYHSESSQAASPLNPRVILFGESGKFVLTFNGDPSQIGYNHLEVMEFKDAEDKFEFHEVEFHPGESPRISETNPAKCLVCHGKDPHPIWGQYFTWPFAFGSHDDRLTSHPVDERERRHAADMLKAGSFSKYFKGDKGEFDQREAFADFLAQSGTHPRYRNLKRKPENPVWPYLDRVGSKLPNVRPNFRLSLYFSSLNAKRMMRKLKAEKDSLKLQALILLGMLECKTVPAEHELVALLGNPSTTDFSRIVREQGVLDTWSLVREPHVPSSALIQKEDGFNDGVNDSFNRGKYLLFKELALRYPELLDFVSEDWLVEDKDTGLPGLPGLADSVPYHEFTGEYEEAEKVCGHLKKILLTELKKPGGGADGGRGSSAAACAVSTGAPIASSCETTAVAVKEIVRAVSSEIPHGLQSCKACHTAGKSKYIFHLESPVAFKDQLQLDSSLARKVRSSIETKSMPPEAPLSDAEIAEILEFLPR